MKHPLRYRYKFLSILFLAFLANNTVVFGQADSNFTIRNFTNYHYISSINFVKYQNYVSASRQELLNVYNKELSILIDSVLYGNSFKLNHNDSSVLLKIQQKLLYHKGRINDKDRDIFNYWLFRTLTLSDKYEINDRSSIEMDIFLDSCQMLSRTDVSDWLIEKFDDKININPFSFGKSYRAVNIICLQNNVEKINFRNFSIVGDDDSMEYINAVNDRFSLLMQHLNDRYILIKINTYYP